MKSVHKALLGKKLGMTQLFAEDGRAVPVTVIEAGPCYVVQRRTAEKDGYEAVQLGFEELPAKRVNKPTAGHFKSAGDGVPACRRLTEVRLYDYAGYEVGEKINAGIFSPGERVDVVATSKGKGFQGVQKRYGFTGGPATHGSHSHRRPGSGGATDPARVFKGTKRPGHMGNVRRTVQGLRIWMVDAERNLLAVRGAVPGPNGGLVLLAVSRQAPAKGDE